jgi:SCY1-like protein 1
VPDVQSTPMVRASSTADIVDQPAPESPTTSTDGWGDLDNGIIEDQESEKDGWDDILPLEDLNPSPALASIQAAQKRPVAQTKPQGNIHSFHYLFIYLCIIITIIWHIF